MKTIQEVQAYLKRETPVGSPKTTPEGMMHEVLTGLANKCQSVDEFIEKAQRIPVTGAGAEEVQIANEQRAIILEDIQR